MLGDTGGAQVLVNGNLAVSWVDSTFEGELDGNGELDRANAGISLSGAATLELALAAGTDVAGSFRLALITRPNLVTVAVGANRQISLYNNAGSVDLLVDLGGFYTPDYGAAFMPLPPSRVLDPGRHRHGWFDRPARRRAGHRSGSGRRVAADRDRCGTEHHRGDRD